MSLTSTPFFSIVIPTLNEEKYLPLLLRDLATQTFKDFEVIHVDANSDDKTVEKADSFQEKISLRTILSTLRNVSHQRNTGAEAAQGQWVIFMDADNRLPKHFLERLAWKLKTQPSELFTCFLETNSLNILHKNLTTLTNAIIEFSANIRPFSPGALIGIRRDLLTYLSFNPHLKISEDHHFMSEAFKRGYHLAVFSEPRYSYSMRRFKKVGSVKMLVTYLRGAFVVLAGEKFEKIAPEYPMLGGAFYHTQTTKKTSFPDLRAFVQKLSSKQLEQLRQLAVNFQETLRDE